MDKIINKIIKLSKPSSLRIERKVKIPQYLSQLLKFEFLRLGFFTQYPNKIIESIYFDDEKLNFLRSNLDGNSLRIKPRARWYDNNISNVNHEFKIKRGFVGCKVINEDLLLNIKDKKDIILKCNNYHKEIFQFNLFEKNSIKYERSYLIHPSKIRLTIDKNIHSKSPNSKYYKKLPFEVIEFKYSDKMDNYFRKTIFPKLNWISVRMTKCSKYAESMIN